MTEEETKESVKKKREKTPAMIANPGGRPSEFDEAAPKIIELIRKGNTYECASGCARITYNTFNNWMRAGQESYDLGDFDCKFFKFLCDVKQAETDAENEVLGHWKDCIPGNWQAAKSFLERRNPDKWGAKDRVDFTSNGQTVGKQIFLPLKGHDEENE